MSDTPRTDALEAEMQKLSYSAPNNYCIELCQQLERELAEREAEVRALHEGHAKLDRILAVGEPCAGFWGDHHLRWHCRCGAMHPSQCKTENAKPNMEWAKVERRKDERRAQLDPGRPIRRSTVDRRKS